MKCMSALRPHDYLQPAITKAFLYGKAALIVVYDHRDAPIGPKLCEPILLLDVLANVDALPCIICSVCFLELLQDDAGFPAIGCTEREQLNALVGLQSGRSLVRHFGQHT